MNYRTGKEFNEAHGNDFTVIGNWLYFSDGAIRENKPQYGQIQEPTDPYEKACNILVYWETKLRRATNQFFDLKKVLHKKASEPKMRNPLRSEIDELKSLHKKVQQLKEQTEMAEAEVQKTMPQDRKNYEARVEKNHTEGEKILEQLSKFEV